MPAKAGRDFPDINQNRCDILKKFLQITLNGNAMIEPLPHPRRWLGSSAPLESCPRRYGLKLGGSRSQSTWTRNVDSTHCGIDNGMGQSMRPLS